MDTKKRRALIIELVSKNEVQTQAQLAKLLEQNGAGASQATLSRDISELEIKKRENENGVMCYFAGNDADELSYSEIFAQSVISSDHSMNMVVLKCHAGMADAACKVVDERKFSGVLGTIAGDDTVFILTKSENRAGTLAAEIMKLAKL